METEQKLQRAHPRAVLLVSDVIGGEEAEGVHTVFARASKGDVQYQKHKLHPFCLDDSYVAVGQSSSTPDNIFVPPQPDTSVCEYSFCATSGQWVFERHVPTQQPDTDTTTFLVRRWSPTDPLDSLPSKKKYGDVYVLLEQTSSQCLRLRTISLQQTGRIRMFGSPQRPMKQVHPVTIVTVLSARK